MDTVVIKILDYLQDKKKTNFSAYRPAMVERCITRRMAAVGAGDFKEYLLHLQNHFPELDHLLSSLAIHVSSFFRNPLDFEFIRQHILPRLVARKTNRTPPVLRVWSAGCSFGEEPFSMAMLLKEYMDAEDARLSVDIFATDINPAAVDQARKGIYGGESVANVPYGLMRKYFTIQGDAFALRPEIIRMVTFSVYDICSNKGYAPPDSVYGEFDLVFCKNVLIYFNPDYHPIIIEKLYRSLGRGGYLALGQTEGLPTGFKGLTRVNDCCNLYFKT